MHLISTHKHTLVTHLQWPSTLLFWSCKLSPSEWSGTFGDTTIWKTEADKFRSEGGLNLKHTDLKWQKPNIITATCSVSSSMFSPSTCSALPICQISYTVKALIYTLCTWHVHIWTPYTSCAGAPVICYHIIILTVKPLQHKRSLSATV